MPKTGYFYIMASRPDGALYVGVTSNLLQRNHQHKSGAFSGFSSKYKTDRLVYYEVYDDITEAILREKRVKKWNRSWKVEMIEKSNPDWRDLMDEF